MVQLFEMILVLRMLNRDHNDGWNVSDKLEVRSAMPFKKGEIDYQTTRQGRRITIIKEEGLDGLRGI